MKLIDNWKAHLLHAWSVRLMALGLLMKVIQIVNDAGLLNIWSAMPDKVQAMFPDGVFAGVQAALYAAAILAKLVQQTSLSGGSNGQ